MAAKFFGHGISEPWGIGAQGMAKRDYYAHSGHGVPPDGWQLLKAHLDNVAGEARAKASKFGAGGLAYAAGVLHDIGKYSDKFQARLRGAKLRADHSTAGAQLAASQYGPAGTLIAYAIAGHHAGLANGSDSNDAHRSTLKTRLADDTIPPFGAWRQELGLPAPGAMQGPKLKFHPNRAVSRERCGFRVGFFVRMLFSCLVDADYLDTEAHYDSIENRNRERGRWPTLAELKTAFDAHMDEKARFARPGDVNRLRAEVLSAARTAAAKSPGLFTLTVPTGGGKTLSSLAFALDHAFRHSLDRIIYVIPFTSIIEQTAAVFQEALGAHAESVIEHHSAFDEDALSRKLAELAKSGDLNARDKLKLATENWDAPIIVTTAVQFFESLFAAAPSRCRKLHNIARSVIILDEAQTMPVTLLKPSVAALDELARNYGASVVLCTATQPALIETTDKEASFEGGFLAKEVREIVPEPERLFAALKRVNVHRVAQPIDDEDLAG